MKDRSVGAALVLTFFFGPLGLLYVSILGGILLSIVAAVVVILTLGLAWPVFVLVSMIWAGISASNQHSKYQAWLAGR
jgi:sterol desaturase/sphingolipid hydroxylase (fatty acid hydroxylase superfamily)